MTPLHDAYKRILAGKTLEVEFFDRKSYDSFRTSLLRKFRETRRSLESLGASDPFEGQYLKATFDAAKVSGTFCLAAEEQKSNVPRRPISIKEL